MPPEPTLSEADLRVDYSRYRAIVQGLDTVRVTGRVQQVVGLSMEVDGLSARLGDVCSIERVGEPPIQAEIMGFREGRTLVMPFGDVRGIQTGARAISQAEQFRVPVGNTLLGRVLDGLGNPIDGLGPLAAPMRPPFAGATPNVLSRRPIDTPLTTGVRAIDGLLTCGQGQRIGIFAGSGVGKSTVLGMIARHASSDVNVIALIGERGREVREFIERDLGPAGLSRSVVVVSTSDEPALLRMKAAWVATTIAEEFRDRGLSATLMMDSVTRFAMAQREIALATGEPPAVKGYTPSVFATLSKLLERTGTGVQGAITGFYTVLVEGDDMTEPVADAARGILDGHIVLSRKLAERVHFPAIDVLGSISRVADQVSDQNHMNARRHVSRLLAAYREAEELIQIGAYAKGSNPDVDAAIAMRGAIDAFLKQGAHERNEYPRTLRSLIELSLAAEGAGRKPNQPQAAAPRKG